MGSPEDDVLKNAMIVRPKQVPKDPVTIEINTASMDEAAVKDINTLITGKESVGPEGAQQGEGSIQEDVMQILVAHKDAEEKRLKAIIKRYDLTEGAKDARRIYQSARSASGMLKKYNPYPSAKVLRHHAALVEYMTLITDELFKREMKKRGMEPLSEY